MPIENIFKPVSTSNSAHSRPVYYIQSGLFCLVAWTIAIGLLSCFSSRSHPGIWLHVQGFFLLSQYPTRHLDTCILASLCLLLPSLSKTLQGLCQVPSLHFVLCFWIKTMPGVWLACHSYFSPSLCFFERLQLMFLWLSCGFLFPSSFIFSL